MEGQITIEFVRLEKSRPWKIAYYYYRLCRSCIELGVVDGYQILARHMEIICYMRLDAFAYKAMSPIRPDYNPYYHSRLG